jgi:hypothetical protein
LHTSAHVLDNTTEHDYIHEQNSNNPNITGIAIADTGSTGNYISLNDSHLLTNHRRSNTATNVKLPDGSIISSNIEADLIFDGIPPLTAHISDKMTTSLISIGRLCDAGLTATFTNERVSISDKVHQIISGVRDTTTGLWMLDIQNPINEHLASSAQLIPQQAELFVRRIHHAWGSPVPSTFINAINKGFIKVKGLTSSLVRKYSHLLDSTPSAQGHLDQLRHGIQSTKTIVFEQSSTTKKHNKILVQVIEAPRRHTDLTGQFPIASKAGHLYHMIMYCQVSKYIHVELMKSRKAVDFVEAYRRGNEYFKARGVHPEFERLDNETSELLKNYCKKENIIIQYVPPGNHRANSAERAIRTWKNHFIAILCGLDPNFPLFVWDELIEQAELTINMLREGIDESISAWESVNGIFSFDKHPIASLGMRVLCHDKPSERKSWAPHGQIGYYVGPAMEHYRCFKIWIPSTSAIRITDTVAWGLHDPILPPIPQHSLKSEIIITNEKSIKQHDNTNLQSLEEIPHNHSELQRVETPQSEHLSLPTTANIPTEENSIHDEPSFQNPATIANTRSDWTTITRKSKRTLHMNPKYANSAVGADKIRQKIKFKKALNSEDTYHWNKAAIEEFDRLISDTNTMHFIAPSSKPTGRVASYYNPQCEKKIKDGNIVYRVRGTVGGNVSDYNGDRTAWTADLETVKLLLNAVISEKDTEWMTIDIKDFYLGTTLDRPEFMWIDRWQIPDEIFAKYNITLVNNKAMVKIDKGIYGLPHAGKIAQERLIKHLATHGFHQTPNTNCLFRHESKPIAFTLVVDDFGIKYKGIDNAEYLIKILRLIYTITVDWSGERYLGMHINRNRLNNTIRISMPNYIEQMLLKLNISKHDRDTHNPVIYSPPKYGLKIQYSDTDKSPLLPQNRIKFIQKVCGNLLYYARTVDPTMLAPILKISSNQAKPTEAVEKAALHLLQYAATHPNAGIVFKPSNMKLVVHSDASYLSETGSRSRAGGYFFLADNNDPLKTSINGAIECVSVILPTVCASAHEAEYAALFINGQRTENLKNILSDLGYPQGATPIIGDNQTCIGVATNTKKMRRSQSMDMRYNWIKDRTLQGHFNLIWHPGKSNLADYFTKIHPKKHYINSRPIYVTDHLQIP